MERISSSLMIQVFWGRSIKSSFEQMNVGLSSGPEGGPILVPLSGCRYVCDKTQLRKDPFWGI